MIKCKKGHNDGWIVEDEFLLDESMTESIYVTCRCNHLNCKEKKKFRFSMYDIKEVA